MQIAGGGRLLRGLSRMVFLLALCWSVAGPQLGVWQGRAQETLAVVINEFGQGTAGSGEWVELLVVGAGACSTVDLRGFRLLDREGYRGLATPTRAVFRSIAAWAAVPAGTIIVVYNGTPGEAGNFPPGFPFNDLDFSDFRVSIPHNNADFFENVAWGGFGNAGDYVVLVNALGTLVDGLSYGNRTGEATAPEVKLGTVGANTAAWFTGGSAAAINSAAHWATGSESGGASTPGAANGGANTTWIHALRPYAATAVTPSSHAFGNVTVGQTSAPLLVTVTNTGCAPLTVGTITLTGPNPDQFGIQNDTCSGQTIPPGGSRTLKVVFRPTSPGEKSAQLSIPSNAPLATVALSGNGVLPVYTVQVSAHPPAGGTVTGGGTYPHGTTVTVTATANAGYRFVNWTEGAAVVSTEVTYTFTATANRTLVANFQLIEHVIRVRANPAQGGSVAGGGTYPHGTTVTVTATANPRYRFLNWTEGGSEVSTASAYTFTASADRDLVANFLLLGDVNFNGALDVGDVRIIHQAALGLVTLSSAQRLAADVNGDGKITVADAEMAASWIVHCP